MPKDGIQTDRRAFSCLGGEVVSSPAADPTGSYEISKSFLGEAELED